MTIQLDFQGRQEKPLILSLFPSIFQNNRQSGILLQPERINKNI